MRVLLDSHVVVAISLHQLRERFPSIAMLMEGDESLAFVSTASLWEIAIKARLGKLNVGAPVRALPRYLEALGVVILPVTADHAVASVSPEPATKDPFDRMLLAQCHVEGLQLATADRALVGHPLAWRE
jgi:PIN domain nuclease of toxin-antitoxin system